MLRCVKRKDTRGGRIQREVLKALTPTQAKKFLNRLIHFLVQKQLPRKPLLDISRKKRNIRRLPSKKICHFQIRTILIQSFFKVLKI